jgi:serine phosphatase RsbU (regulator of sigma subunit)
MPFLLAENGPLASHQYPLHGQRVIMGRHPNCDLVIDQGAVSRQHAQLTRVADDYYLEDLNSRNGTYVNGTFLEGRHRLLDGDRIRVCDLSFVFRSGVTTPRLDERSAPVLLEDGPDQSSLIMSKLDVLSGSSGSVAIASTPDAKLRALVEISRSLGGAISLERVLPQVLESLFKLFVQADRGFIILRGKDGALVPRWNKVRRGDDNHPIRISRTIVDEVVTTGQAVLSADASEDLRFQMSESIADFRIRSFMCAPLVDVEGHVLGALQLDALDPRNRFRPEDLELLASVASQAAISIDNAQLHERVVRQRMVERDLELAQEVQRGFLPEQAPKMDRYVLGHYYKPADKVGGDYYDYIVLPDGRVAVIVADVVGHGVAASLLTARLSSAARFCLATHDSPAEAIKELNSSFHSTSLQDQFITLVMVVLRPDSDEITVVNAGHMPPVLCGANGPPRDLALELRAPPLLVIDKFDYRQSTIRIGSGDHIVLYTDGLHETMDANGQQYGMDRLRRQTVGHTDGAALIRTLVDDIRRFSGSAPQKDDMCAVCCSRI